MTGMTRGMARKLKAARTRTHMREHVIRLLVNKTIHQIEQHLRAEAER